ncbi:hypothetical protein B0H14DRAFT_2576686 [Mycena olivaceomarginata]|nr:hypothetical protein B0H14DRAFT_2576686 [Mycena olivaceomarginata]
MAPQIRLLAVEQEEKNSAGRSYCARIPSLTEEICKVSPSMLARLPDAPMLAILAEAHAPDEHPAHQGHTLVLYRLSDVCWTVGGQVVLQLAWHGPSRTYASPPPASRWTAGGQVVQRLAWPGPSRTYAIHPPAHALQAAYFQQSVGLSEGRSSAARPGGYDTGREKDECRWREQVPVQEARSWKHGKIIEGSSRLQEQTEGGQRSWTVRLQVCQRVYPPPIEQRQYALRIGSHGEPALTRCDVQSVFLLQSAGKRKDEERRMLGPVDTEDRDTQAQEDAAMQSRKLLRE